VLLVGGMTRMPKVQEAVTEFFGRTPSKQVNPDEAVAIGAAMYAYSLEDDTNLRVQVLDVIPMAIGIEDARGRLHTIFERNAPVPNLKTLTFTTSSVDDQENLEMRIYQGDQAEARKNELLGQFTFSGIRLATAGQVRVEVAFQLTQDGILATSGRHPGRRRAGEVAPGQAAARSDPEADQLSPRRSRLRRLARRPTLDHQGRSQRRQRASDPDDAAGLGEDRRPTPGRA
jgi:molecular chaperone DnaK